jgi:hypothetical protein
VKPRLSGAFDVNAFRSLTYDIQLPASPEGLFVEIKRQHPVASVPLSH